MKVPYGSVPGFIGMMGRFAPFIRPQWRLILLAFVALFAQTVLRLLEPWPVKFIINAIVETPGSDTSSFAGLSTTTVLSVMAAAAVAIAGLRAFASYGETMAFAIAGSRIVTDIRGAVYRHLQQLSLGFHSKARGGDLTTRLITDTGRLQDVTVTAAAPLLSNTVMLAGMLGVMAWLNWQLALVSAVVLPGFILLTVQFTGAIQGAARRAREREGAMASTAAESLGAIKVVQSLSLEDQLGDAFTRQNSAGLVTDVRGKRLEASLERSVDVLLAVGVAGVLWFGAHQVLRDAMTPGDLVVFMTYAKSGFRPVKDIAKFTGRMAKATASGERILGILDTVPEIVDRPGAVAAPPFRGRIAFEHVTFGYEPGHPVLRDVSFVIEPGQNVAFVGASGAGKSTIMNLVLRLYDPLAGRVTIDGRDIRDFTLATLRGQVAIVLQDSVLFAVSARENIAYGAPGATDRQILRAARLANADEFIRALPDGYDTVLGERGATLSGGQRQRIAIARAAVRRSPIVILDEPATGLDRMNEQEVTAALGRLTEAATTLTIAHDPRQLTRADRVFVVADGGVTELRPGQESAPPAQPAGGLWRRLARPAQEKTSAFAG